MGRRCGSRNPRVACSFAHRDTHTHTNTHTRTRTEWVRPGSRALAYMHIFEACHARNPPSPSASKEVVSRSAPTALRHARMPRACRVLYDTHAV